MRLICLPRWTGQSTNLAGKSRNRVWQYLGGHSPSRGSFEGALGTVLTVDQTVWPGNPVETVTVEGGKRFIQGKVNP